MGIHSRDYVREIGPSSGSFGHPGDNWAIKFLLIGNAVVFLLQNLIVEQVDFGGFIGQREVVTSYLRLDFDSLRQLQVWRLITYGFCHGSFQHIAFNMFVLWMFGRLVEPIYGSREFLSFYLCGIVISGLCHVVLEHAHPVIGASGGVNAVVFLCAMHYPRMKVLFMFVIPVEFRFLAVGYALMDLFGAMNPSVSGIAHAAHLGGAAFGVAYKYFGWRVLSFLRVDGWNLGRWKLRRRRKSNPQIRAYRPSAPDFDAQVDQVLAKIKDQGEASLTDEERALLSEASQRYKNRG